MIRFILSLSIIILTSMLTAQVRSSQIPLEDFFKNPEKSSYQISPEGGYFSFMAPVESRMNVFVQGVDSKVAVQVTFEKERDVAGYTWANDNRLIFLKDNAGDENYKLFAVDRDGKNLMGLTDFDKVLTQIIDDLPDNPEEMIIGMNRRDPQVFDAYRINIITGKMKLIAENPGNISEWMCDHDGKLRLAMTTDGVNTSILLRDDEKSRFQTIYTGNYRESLSPQFFTFDNKNLWVLSNIGRNTQAVVKFDVSTGKELAVLFENEKYDVSGLSYSRKDKKLLEASYTAQKRERKFFDKEYATMFDFLERKLPGLEYGITSKTKDESIFIVRTYSDKTRGSYLLFDWKNLKLTPIAEISPWLQASSMADMMPISYKSRDGLLIEGYLTLPKGKENAKGLPLVVNPHGGPWHRDVWGFNPEVQFLASRGYAVLQMNFRGSTGYGRKFWEASFNEWGLKMQDDITDGVNFMTEKGIVDKDRVAIYGASYGGYATLAGLAFTPDLYACGIDYVGVSNLFTFIESIPPYWEPYLEMLYDMVGNPDEDKQRMKETSPSLHADKITAPLFIAQGANDPRVVQAESDQMVAALKKRGVDVEYMVKENEGHGFRNEENQFEFYRMMEKFLSKNLGK
jgi:dipeptidyl aminopeptidase/acylaminoacyl peptidase